MGEMFRVLRSRHFALTAGVVCVRVPWSDQGFEDALGLTSVPINGVGLAVSVGFWLVMFKVCQFVSQSLAGAKYTSLTSLVKSDWDNFAWSMSHGIIGFLVRVVGGGCPECVFVCVGGGCVWNGREGAG